MADELDLSVKKAGTDWLDISAQLRPDGYLLTLKADPKLEEFVASYCTNEVVNLDDFGVNDWKADPEPKVRMINIDLVGDGFFIDKPYGSMYLERTGKVNLSFLRFVGISKSPMTIHVKGPFGRKTLREIVNNMGLAVRSLVKEHLVPAYITVKVFTQEV